MQLHAYSLRCDGISSMRSSMVICRASFRLSHFRSSFLLFSCATFLTFLGRILAKPCSTCCMAFRSRQAKRLAGWRLERLAKRLAITTSAPEASTKSTASAALRRCFRVGCCKASSHTERVWLQDCEARRSRARAK